VLHGFSTLHGATCDVVNKAAQAARGALATGLCPAIGLAVALVPGVQVGAGIMTGACFGGYAAYSKYCSVLKEGGAPQAAWDLEAALLQSIRGVIPPPATKGKTPQLTPSVRVWSLGIIRAVSGSPVAATISEDGILSPSGALRVEVPWSPSDDEGEPQTVAPVDTPPAIRLTLKPAQPTVGSLYTIDESFYGVPQGGRVRMAQGARALNGDGEVKEASAAEIGPDGQHTLRIQRTLGAANAQRVYAQIFNASGSVVAFRNINY